MSIRRVTSNPPRLSGNVGKSASNRPHDVALVQALLGEVKDRGRPLLKDHVTGRFDRDTEQALGALFKAANDRSPNPRLATGHPLFAKIAQNQSLTVVEGTAAPYEARRTAPKPRITFGKYESGNDIALSPNEQAKLETVVADLGRSLGLAFNLHVEAAPSDPDILIAHFIPVGCLVHNGRQWCRNINSEDAIRNANPALFSLLAHQIRERAAIDFPITAAADQAADNALKTEFTAIVRPKVVASLGFANKHRGAGYLLGLDIAKKMIEHYLSATGDPLIVTREEALSFDLIREAVDTNVERIREENFLQPPTTNPSYQVIVAALNASPGTKSTFTDEWKYDFNVTSTPGIRRYLEGYLEDGSATMSFLFGPGSSHLTSTGAFNLTRQADHIEVSGTVTHTWKDEGYNFDPGKFFAEEAAALEAAGLAKPFSWAAVWKDRIEGTLAFRSVQPTITSGLLRWESFEVHPAPMPPQ